MQVHMVFVALADPEGKTLVPFYAALFGRQPVVHQPPVYAEFELPGLRLGIFQPKLGHLAEFMGRAGSMSLCVEVEQLEAAIAQATALGCPPASEITTASHGREVYVYDPAGNRLILHESFA